MTRFRTSFLLLVLSATGAGAQQFADSRLRHVDDRGQPYTDVSWARDLNGDGHVDFVGTSGDLSWGNGDSSFRIGALPTPGPGMRIVAAEDLDGDGDVDVLRTVTGGLAAQDNDGTGAFGAPRTAATGLGFVADVLPGDLDGDGDPDLVVTYLFNSAPFGVLRNDGTGRFTDVSATALPALRPGIPRALGDVDGDGDLDIYGAALINPDPLWVNDGSGSFSLATGRFPSHARIVVEAWLVDVDGDGDLDLGTAFSTTAQEPTIRFARNDGAGWFAYPPAPSCPSLGNAFVTLGDLDGDGDVDLITTTEIPAARTGALQSYFNDGGGTFVPRASQRFHEGLEGKSVLADVDGDGDLDVFFGGRLLLLHDGSGAFVDATRSAVPDVPAWSVAAGDVDADGDVDLVRDRVLLRNDGSGWFAPEALPARGSNGEIGALADLDLDGDLDAVLIDGGRGFNAWGFLWNDGTGVFQLTVSTSTPATFHAGVRVADFDHDGLPDLFGPSELLWNRGGRAFVRVPSSPLWQDSRGFDVGDLDSNGELDIVAGSGAVFMGRGGFAFRQIAVPGMAMDVALDLKDVDGDGDLDAIGLGSGTGGPGPFAEVWLNDGLGVLGNPTRFALPGAPKAQCLVDVDADGDLDLAVGLRDATPTVALLLNDGSGRFVDATAARVPAIRLAGESNALIAVDVDRDGDDDFVVGGHRSFVLANRFRQLDAPRVPRLGHDYVVELSAKPGFGTAPRVATALLALRRLPTPIVLPGLGTVLIDPATAIATPAATIPPSGTLSVPIRVPNDVRLAGITLFWQGLVADGAVVRTTGMVIAAITR